MQPANPINSSEAKLAEVEDLFSFIMKVQSQFSSEVATLEESTLGEGRIGALMIRGAKEDGSSWSRVFEVSKGGLVPASDLDSVRTVIVFEGIDIFRSVCQELLAGNVSAFSRARARGEVKVLGNYAVRDFSIFNRLLSKVGAVLRGYGVKYGD